MSEALGLQDKQNRIRLEKCDFDRNLMVSAGAGAGKTYTTVERVFNMLCDPEAKIEPQDIVMITMTIRAATEMKTRLSDKIRLELGKETDPGKRKRLEFLMASLPDMQISTIHSFCRRILNDYPLESGVGFAPQYESEEGALKNTLKLWLEDAWKAGRCPECQRIGIKQGMALKHLKALNQYPTTVPQFADPDSEEFGPQFEETLKECHRVVERFSSSMDEDIDPDVFEYRIRDAIAAGEDATDEMAINAVRVLASNYKNYNWWMGQKAGKLPARACDGLRYLLELKEDTDETLEIMGRLLVKGDGCGKEERRTRILQEVSMLPPGYRDAARMIETLPDGETMKNLAADIDRMIHGVISKELYELNKAYEQERHANHVVMLQDMLVRMAELMKNDRVRKKLHDRYKVFFVDEYQDTNPIQTDIIFAIAADRYDPDWRKSTPEPGRLFLVGDAKQGIYRFTGADIALWKEAEDFIKGTGDDKDVVTLSKNFRSTPEIIEAVSGSFGPGKDLAMADDEYQVAFQEMVADRKDGVPAVFHHVLPCDEAGMIEGEEVPVDPFKVSAEQVARYIRHRVDHEGNSYGDFMVMSFYRETNDVYSDMFRKYKIPVKYDAILRIDRYHPIELLNLRVQAVMHPFDERLSFQVLCECGDVMPQEWDLFRMTLKKLPPETNLTVYRDTRSLMDHVEELERLLPRTDMNRNILKALSMLNNDRKLSQHREPCAFLDELVEKSEGLFRQPYDSEEYRNQYAALKHVIDSIRDKNPQHFDEMAKMLQAVTESELDRMPTVRADENYVWLVNLHKVKGLERKILIFLPSRLKEIRADQNVVRTGCESKGWFVLKPDGRGASYNPPDWKEHNEAEKAFLKAERIRLKYVALTRAKDEAHFFEFRPDPNYKGRKELAWKGFESVGGQVPEKLPENDEVAVRETGESPEAVRAEQAGVMSGIAYVNEKNADRKTPSAIDKESEQEELLRIQDLTEDEEAETDPLEAPGGKDWGSAVHRAAELVVTEGTFTAESVRAAAEQAVTEEFDSELLSRQERENLQLPEDKVSLADIRSWLTEQIANRLSFMMDETSEFRKDLQGAEVHTELPFVITVSPSDGKVYDRLADCMNVRNGKRLETNGKIDLALRYPDGTWVIADYKTDRMQPGDHGSKDNFRARLKSRYGNQLECYKAVLEYLTGETVRETKLLTV